jgi:hypothetical protein
VNSEHFTVHFTTAAPKPDISNPSLRLIQTPYKHSFVDGERRGLISQRILSWLYHPDANAHIN